MNIYVFLDPVNQLISEYKPTTILPVKMPVITAVESFITSFHLNNISDLKPLS